MLKRKLIQATAVKQAADHLNEAPPNQCTSNAGTTSSKKNNIDFGGSTLQIIRTSEYFAKPFWQRFYELECTLNIELQQLNPPAVITHVYNPVEYAATIHCAYLQRFLCGPKHLLFIGMNPGPNGMGQTGVPFGNISTVRDVMRLSGEVAQPTLIHSKRPVSGFNCRTEEPSGVRIWTLLERLANGSLDTFSQQCFVHNFCPLAFFDSHGRNITPSELKGDYKTDIRDKCLMILDQQIELVQAQIIVAIGDYVFTTLKKSKHVDRVKILKMPHPSPRALNNQNWPQKAEKFLEDNKLLNYLRNDN